MVGKTAKKTASIGTPPLTNMHTDETLPFLLSASSNAGCFPLLQIIPPHIGSDSPFLPPIFTFTFPSICSTPTPCSYPTREPPSQTTSSSTSPWREREDQLGVVHVFSTRLSAERRGECESAQSRPLPPELFLAFSSSLPPFPSLRPLSSFASRPWLLPCFSISPVYSTLHCTRPQLALCFLLFWPGHSHRLRALSSSLQIRCPRSLLCGEPACRWRAACPSYPPAPHKRGRWRRRSPAGWLCSSASPFRPPPL
mmetsp:Transcript_34223/g.88400  ORF Transcript_34223/g.88400 Transcript_34223/m.88400 type:complete len:254 (+) Transcript_34223:228-989(+)